MQPRVLWGRTSCRASPNPLAWVTRKGQPADNVSKAVTPNPSDLEGIIARSAVDSTVARSSRFARNGSKSTAFSWSRFHLVHPQRRAGNLCHSVELLLRPQCRNPWVQNLLSRPVSTTEHCTSYLKFWKAQFNKDNSEKMPGVILNIWWPKVTSVTLPNSARSNNPTKFL